MTSIEINNSINYSSANCSFRCGNLLGLLVNVIKEHQQSKASSSVELDPALV